MWTQRNIHIYRSAGAGHGKCSVGSTPTAPSEDQKIEFFLACARVRVRECDLVYYINSRRIFYSEGTDEGILQDT